jgi:GH35 family endo-1,4-beta-xylanase
MLSFAVFTNGKPADRVNLAGAYAVGSDDVPLRAEIAFSDGVITCKKRAAGPAGLAILWHVKNVGQILVETIRVQERDKPYILQVELARGRILRLNNKLEDWGMLDFEEAAPWLRQADEARDRLIQALQADEPAKAADLAEDALSLAVQASEGLTQLHAELFIARRRPGQGFPRRALGCALHLDIPAQPGKQRLAKAFDFAALPICWRDVEPTEQNFNWKLVDSWVEALTKPPTPLPIHGYPLLCFRETNVPDWLYIWEHDFDTIRDLAFEHIRRILNRYGQHISSWSVVSGLHAANGFSFNFEQIMELTRLACTLTKQMAPRSIAVIELVAPWGEYYARNQRTIPPMLYADMVVQSGVTFDAFGLKFRFGPGIDGHFVRDLFQISVMLDQFSKLGKPLHVTAVQVPSSTAPVASEDNAQQPIAIDGGSWHGEWSQEIQAEWLQRFVEIALSKSFVESITWADLADHAGQSIPHGGLLQADLSPKPAYERVQSLATGLLGRATRKS